MKKLDIRLFRFIKKMKGQVVAICAIIFIAILLYVSLINTAINLENNLKQYYEETNFSDLFVEIVKIPQNKLKNIENIEGIEKVDGRIKVEVPLEVNPGEKNAKLRLVSIDEGEILNNLYITEGRTIENEKEVIIIEQFANDRKIKVGDTFKVQLLGKEYKLKVSGIGASPEYIYLMENEQSLLPAKGKFGIVFCNEDFLQKALGYDKKYNELSIKLKNYEDVDGIEDLLEEKLDKYGLKRITKREDQLSNHIISDEIKSLKKTANTVPIVFLFISAIIIMVIIMRMVARDRMTVGILKAMGFTNYDILMHYTKYSFFIGSISSILGAIGGLLLSRVLTKVYISYFNMPILKTNIYFRYIFYALIITTLISMGAGMIGSRKVAHIVPSEAMRTEPPKTGKRILLEQVTFIWEKLNFSWKVVLRNIFRNKKRFITITMGVALTYSITLFPIYQNFLFQNMFTNHYGNFQRMDYNINFTKPMNENVVIDLNNLIETQYIEPKVEYPFEIENGWKSKVVNIIGVKRETPFFNFLTLNNYKINMPEDGIVLSENLAKVLSVDKGDIVKINNFIPYRADVEILVKGIVKQDIGINGYMDIEVMQRKLVDKKMITGVYVKSNDDIKSKLEDITNINSIESLEDLRNTFKEFLKMTLASIGILILFAGILGFGIIYNASIINISERTLEFSTLQILGFTKGEIYKMILKETIIMTILGIAMGIPLGIKMVEGVANSFSTDLYTLNPHVDIEVHIITGITTSIFIIMAQLFTMRKIKGLDLMKALKTRVS